MLVPDGDLSLPFVCRSECHKIVNVTSVVSALAEVLFKIQKPQCRWSLRQKNTLHTLLIICYFVSTKKVQGTIP